jgi:KDO2-lipid IV(A) lauroyltransferase
VWAPFFGRPAYTMTLAARLALQAGAPVLLARCERLDRGRGFRLVLEPMDPPLPTVGSGDALLQAQAEAVNRALERQVLQCPQQYLWGYHRYKGPRGGPHGEVPP